MKRIFKQITSGVMALLFSLPVMGSATVAHAAGNAVTATVAGSEVRLAAPRSGDKELDGIVEKLFFLIKGLCGGVGTTCKKLAYLISQLITILQSYFVAIDTQIASSKCHNRSCSEYGARESIAPVTQLRQ